MAKLKSNTLYKFNPPEQSVAYWKSRNMMSPGDTILVLGEISNMPDHYIIVDRTGAVVWGLHPDNFKELNENEV